MDKLLIDADSIFFKVACVTHNKGEIRKLIRLKFEEIQRYNFSEDMMVAVKGKGNFRKEVYPLYKSNRPDLDADRKVALNYGWDFVLDKYGAIPADNMEADDLVSIWAHEAAKAGVGYTVVGIDKDLLQIPGSHYNFDKKSMRLMGKDDAYRHLMLQCLTGDRTDGIPGIYGIGPKKAEKILTGVSTDNQWNRVRAAWRGHKAGDPMVSHRLLKMLESWEEFEKLKLEIENGSFQTKR